MNWFTELVSGFKSGMNLLEDHGMKKIRRMEREVKGAIRRAQKFIFMTVLEMLFYLVAVICLILGLIVYAHRFFTLESILLVTAAMSVIIALMITVSKK